MTPQIVLYSSDTRLIASIAAACGLTHAIQCCTTLAELHAALNAGGVSALIFDGAVDEARQMCRHLRPALHAPIIVLIERDDAEARAAVLRAGADDAISRPFAEEVLRARLRAKLRRAAFERRARAVETPATVRQTVLERRRLHLSPMEQRLLALLRDHAGAIVPFEVLQRALWHDDVGPGRLRYHIHQLRYRLSRGGSEMRIEIARGDGYRLVH